MNIEELRTYNADKARQRVDHFFRMGESATGMKAPDAIKKLADESFIQGFNEALTWVMSMTEDLPLLEMLKLIADEWERLKDRHEQSIKEGLKNMDASMIANLIKQAIKNKKE